MRFPVFGSQRGGEGGSRLREGAMSWVAGLIGLILGSALLGAASSVAAEAPWCLETNEIMSPIEICRFQTFEQCNAQRSQQGGIATCKPNPYYLPSSTGRDAQERKAKTKTNP